MTKTTRLTTTTDHDLLLFDTIGPVQDPLLTAGLFLQGTSGHDLITGSMLNDMILGLAGSDKLYGEDGDDWLDGGLGNDLLVGGRGADAMFGGDGIDTASYASAATGIRADLTLAGLSGEAAGDTYSGIENLIGSRFNDWLYGDAGNNRLDGGRGNDILIGDGGNDWLIGGLGVDSLYGDLGRNPGADIFQVSFEGGGVYDHIMDFQPGFDKILLAGFDNSAFGRDWRLATGDITAPLPYPAGRDLSLDDKVFYDTNTDILYAITVELIENHITVTGYEPIVHIDRPNHSFLPTAGDFIFA
jgi:Ca2+-binding RTX toxin-like protein